MDFLILGNGTKPSVPIEAERLQQAIESLGSRVVLVDLFQKRDLYREVADIALVLGGDGAILRASRQMEYHQIPVLGINLGRLGFLADLSVEDLYPQLPHVLKGEFRLTTHMMFKCIIEWPGGKTQILGLNDVVIRSGPPFHMIDLELCIDDETVTRFLGDGIIISTPIGSTAYCLAAGGPILGQDLSAFVITPLCGHTLTTRPLVDSAEHTYTIRIRQTDGAFLVVDGHDAIELTNLHRVTILRSNVPFQLVRLPGRSFYQTLREKMNWGTMPNYRSEPNPG